MDNDETEIMFEGSIEELSEASLLSPSSSITQSRPESRISKNTEGQQREYEPRNLKRQKLENTPKSRVRVKETDTFARHIK